MRFQTPKRIIERERDRTSCQKEKKKKKRDVVWKKRKEKKKRDAKKDLQQQQDKKKKRKREESSCHKNVCGAGLACAVACLNLKHKRLLYTP